MEQLLQQAIDRTATLMDAVPAEQYGSPTSCEGWDVRALMNHLVAGNLVFGQTARGEQADMGAFGQDHLGDGAPGETYRRAAAAAVAGWRRPGALEEVTSFGMPGDLVFGMHLTEELVHCWDLARATGQDAALPLESCEAALGLAHRLPEDQMRQPSVFGPEVEVGADAPADQRLVAFTGRDPAK